MCDYSLCGIPNRLAEQGEELVVHKFTTGSIGLASPADLPMYGGTPKPKVKLTFWQAFSAFFSSEVPGAVTTAVCIPPGAQLVISGIPPELQGRLRISDREAAVFTQINAEENNYRDAVRFPSGREVLLQNLCEGMRVEVLSLTGAAESVTENAGAMA